MSLKRKLSLYAAVVVAIVATPAIALAKAGEAAAAAGAASNQWDTNGMLGLAAGIAIGLAVLGGALGQGRAVSSAVEGIARQPSAQAKIQTPLILGLAFIESLVLFAWAMAFILQSNMKF